MKKSASKIICFFLVGLLLAGCQTTTSTNLTEYVIPAKLSQTLLGYAPENFQENQHKIFSQADFLNNSRVDDSGNLVLKLSKEQETTVLEFYDSKLNELNEIDGVDISEDYKTLNIIGDENTISEIYWNNMGIYTIHDMAFRQLFNGNNPETISVTVTITEQGTSKKLYTATWPNEKIVFSVKNYEFSN